MRAFSLELSGRAGAGGGDKARYVRTHQRPLSMPAKAGAQGRNRTTDTAIFSRMLYQLSYLGIRSPDDAGGRQERAVIGGDLAGGKRPARFEQRVGEVEQSENSSSQRQAGTALALPSRPPCEAGWRGGVGGGGRRFSMVCRSLSRSASAKT
jgi:hypothetical protein